MPLTPDLRDHLRQVAAQLDAAGHGDSSQIIANLRETYGWSRDTAYRNLRAAGWTSGRKARSDKGRTSMEASSLVALGALQRESIRANGKQTMFLPVAKSIAIQSGMDVPVSTRQVARLLKAERLDVASQRVSEPVQHLRAPHPNHTHQVDPSLCLLFYMRGKQYLMRDDEFYKNKLEKFAKVQLKVWRYVGYDRASGAIAVHYFEAAGESATNLFKFLHWLWSPKTELTFHGVPKFLLWDKGSANTAASIKNWLQAMEVKALEHAPGKARVKGGVENGNNIVETSFESRLRFSPVHTVEELNAAAWAWCEAYNANRIPNQDTRLSRPGIGKVSRYDLWMRIRADQLRLPPAIEVSQALMAGKVVTRKVGADLSITFKHPTAGTVRTYSLEGLPGICARDVVEIRPLVFGNCAVLVRVPLANGEDIEHRVEPNVAYDEFGQREDAAVIGEEYKAVKHTAIEAATKQLDAAAYPEKTAAEAQESRRRGVVPFNGQIDAIEHLRKIERTAYLPKRGTQINVPQSVHVEVTRLNHIQAAAALSRMVPGWGPELFQRMASLYPDGVFEEELAAVAARLTGAGMLRVVGA